jgi:hypothetical protein
MTALIESRGKPITDWSYPGKYKQIQAYADAKPAGPDVHLRPSSPP